MGDSLLLVSKIKSSKRDVNKCICQKENRSQKTTSTENGRKKIMDASSKFNGELLDNVADFEIFHLNYHSGCCNKSYVLRGERFKPNEKESETEEVDCFSPPRPKRVKTVNVCHLSK